MVHAGGPAAIDRPPSPQRTIWCTGSAAAPPTWTTSFCYAAGITGWCMRVTGRSSATRMGSCLRFLRRLLSVDLLADRMSEHRIEPYLDAAIESAGPRARTHFKGWGDRMLSPAVSMKLSTARAAVAASRIQSSTRVGGAGGGSKLPTIGWKSGATGESNEARKRASETSAA